MPSQLSLGLSLEQNDKNGYFSSKTKFYFMGSGPDRRQNPVEWGEIPSVCPSIHTYTQPPPAGPLMGPETLLAGPQTPLAGPQAPVTNISGPSGRPLDLSVMPSESSGNPQDLSG